MPQTPDLTKYLDTGAEFVALSRKQARERAQELVQQGQLAQNQVQGFVDGLVEGSRRRTDLLMDGVRQEIQRQVQSVGIATKDDLAKLEAKLTKQTKASTKSAPKSAREGRRRRRRRRRPTARPSSRRSGRPGPRRSRRRRRSRSRPASRPRPLASTARRRARATRAGPQPGACRRGHRRRARDRGRRTRDASRRARSRRPRRSRSPAPPARFVSRGGEKLDAALDAWAIDVRGRRVLDAGASTGGFTDCLRQRGADPVVAVDVGHGQLAWSLRNDPGVVVMERTNLRHLEALPGGPAELAVADLSFISLRTVAPALVRLTVPTATFVLLVKPQFEAGRSRIGSGGIVRDPAVHREVLAEVVDGLGAHGDRDRRRPPFAADRRRRQRGVPRPGRAAAVPRWRTPCSTRVTRMNPVRRVGLVAHPDRAEARRPRPAHPRLGGRQRHRRARRGRDRGTRSTARTTRCCRSGATARCCAPSTSWPTPTSRCSA